jgi:hypothetical protein
VRLRAYLYGQTSLHEGPSLTPVVNAKALLGETPRNRS